VQLVHLWLSVFFSSRRRHTRFSRDWSSDVCSSDLASADHVVVLRERDAYALVAVPPGLVEPREEVVSREDEDALRLEPCVELRRSEERRVGKECSAGWAPQAERQEK